MNVPVQLGLFWFNHYKLSMTTNFRLLGPVHLCILGAVPLFAGLLAFIQRGLAPGTRALRIGLGCFIVLDGAVYYGYLIAHGQLTFPDHLPLELCDASLCLVIVALFTLNKRVFDLAYYGALAGATMALLTPNLWEPFPSFSTIQFFVDHGLIVVGALFLAWSGQARPRPGSVLRAMVGVNLFAACVGTFDYFYKTDYMYLRAKPPNASLLDVLGPWPWYIFAAEGVAFVVFLLLYLPFRQQSDRKLSTPASAPPSASRV
ncbi:MAG: TIGR02206 family membrane protein [Terracidiphilus sp.]